MEETPAAGQAGKTSRARRMIREWKALGGPGILVAIAPSLGKQRATRPRCEGSAGNEMETNAHSGNEDGNEPKNEHGDGNEKAQKGVSRCRGECGPILRWACRR